MAARKRIDTTWRTLADRARGSAMQIQIAIPIPCLKRIDRTSAGGPPREPHG
jgi:hypothetical protein